MNQTQPSEADQILLGDLRAQFCRQRYKEAVQLSPRPSSTDTKQAVGAGQK